MSTAFDLVVVCEPGPLAGAVAALVGLYGWRSDVVDLRYDRDGRELRFHGDLPTGRVLLLLHHGLCDAEAVSYVSLAAKLRCRKEGENAAIVVWGERIDPLLGYQRFAEAADLKQLAIDVGVVPADAGELHRRLSAAMNVSAEGARDRAYPVRLLQLPAWVAGLEVIGLEHVVSGICWPAGSEDCLSLKSRLQTAQSLLRMCFEKLIVSDEKRSQLMIGKKFTKKRKVHFVDDEFGNPSAPEDGLYEQLQKELSLETRLSQILSEIQDIWGTGKADLVLRMLMGADSMPCRLELQPRDPNLKYQSLTKLINTDNTEVEYAYPVFILDLCLGESDQTDVALALDNLNGHIIRLPGGNRPLVILWSRATAGAAFDAAKKHNWKTYRKNDVTAPAMIAKQIREWSNQSA